MHRARSQLLHSHCHVMKDLSSERKKKSKGYPQLQHTRRKSSKVVLLSSYGLTVRQWGLLETAAWSPPFQDPLAHPMIFTPLISRCLLAPAVHDCNTKRRPETTLFRASHQMKRTKENNKKKNNNNKVGGERQRGKTPKRYATGNSHYI